MNTEPRLADEIRNGNEEALFSLMTLYYNDLYKYGLRFTAESSLTKDILQQFFLHIWENRKKLQAVGNIKGYVVVAFKRFLIQELRKISRQVALDVQSTDELEYPYEDYIIIFQQEKLLRKILFQAIKILSPRQKELLRLRYYEQLSYDEIAKKTSLSKRTIYNKIHEALKKLRSHVLLGRFHKNMYC